MTGYSTPGLFTAFIIVSALLPAPQAKSHETAPGYEQNRPAYNRNDFYYQSRIAPPPSGYIYRQRSNHRGCRPCSPRDRYIPNRNFNYQGRTEQHSAPGHFHGNRNIQQKNSQYYRPNRINYPPPGRQLPDNNNSHQHSHDHGAKPQPAQPNPPQKLPQMDIPSIEPLTP